MCLEQEGRMRCSSVVIKQINLQMFEFDSPVIRQQELRMLKRERSDSFICPAMWRRKEILQVFITDLHCINTIQRITSVNKKELFVFSAQFPMKQLHRSISSNFVSF